MDKTIQFPCRFLKKYMKPTLRELYDLTQKNDREYGLYIYEQDGDIHRTQIQTGRANSIGIKMKSVLGEGIINAGIPLATIHSHPTSDYDYLFSSTDFKTIINDGLEFAAIVFRDPQGPRCSVYSTDGYQSYRELEDSMLRSREGYGRGVAELDIVEEMNNKLRICEFKV